MSIAKEAMDLLPQFDRSVFTSQSMAELGENYASRYMELCKHSQVHKNVWNSPSGMSKVPDTPENTYPEGGAAESLAKAAMMGRAGRALGTLATGVTLLGGAAHAGENVTKKEDRNIAHLDAQAKQNPKYEEWKNKLPLKKRLALIRANENASKSPNTALQKAKGRLGK